MEDNFIFISTYIDAARQNIHPGSMHDYLHFKTICFTIADVTIANIDKHVLSPLQTLSYRTTYKYCTVAGAYTRLTTHALGAKVIPLLMLLTADVSAPAWVTLRLLLIVWL